MWSAFYKYWPGSWAQKHSWIIKLQPKIWNETVAHCDLDRHFISSSIFVYRVDEVLVPSSWQRPSFWKVSYSSLSQAVMSNFVWFECQAVQKSTGKMKLASCCFFGNLDFFFADHQLWWVENAGDKGKFWPSGCQFWCLKTDPWCVSSLCSRYWRRQWQWQKLLQQFSITVLCRIPVTANTLMPSWKQRRKISQPWWNLMWVIAKGTGFGSAFHLIVPGTEKWICLLSALEMGWMFYSVACWSH